MEKCADLNKRRGTLLSCGSSVRGNSAAPHKKSQLDSSVNCVQTLELIKPTVFKVSIKDKYEIRTTDICPSLKQPPDSSQLNLGKVTAWSNTNSVPTSLKRQTTQSWHTRTEPQRCPPRSTNPKDKTPLENKMSFIAAFGTKCGLLERTSSRASSCRSLTFSKNESKIQELKFQSLDDELENLIQQIIDEQHITSEDNTSPNHDAEDHISKKEMVMETPCETVASSVTLDSEFQQTEVNVHETLHLYLPIHDIQEEEEFTTTGEPCEDVSQNLEVSSGDLKRKQNYKNTKTKQEEKNGNWIKDSAWASPPGSRFKDHMQRRLTHARKSVPAPAVNVNSIEQKKYSEILEDPWSRLNQTQPLKHNYIDRPMFDLTIYDLEAELDNTNRLQEGIYINNS
ncbi:uncharacterized protein LOC121281536 [Carcharodon carcharias]|uniref:uncharacterized protein LOC121281536 n=1 Tax=Carcharodon carcharias TaxID=13397 RepID=UPI001B7F10A4|nr:uncharacterized protein LOC121281536 [Carcharodon carcharias]